MKLPLALLVASFLVGSLTHPGEADAASSAAAVVVGGVGSVSAATVDEVAAAGASARRVGGADRYATAAAVALDAFAAPVPVVYLASGRNFPDALAAAAVAGAQGGPVLLTDGDRLPQPTADALRRLRPVRVVAVGGDAAVPETVLRAVSALGAPAPVRVDGADRYATAAAVSRSGYPSGAATAFLASGINFPDALAAAPAAASRRAPVLLSTTSSLPAATRAELVRLSPREVVIVGGTGALAHSVADAVQAAVPSATVRRVGGADRYETAYLIASTFLPDATSFYLASGAAFPDALVAAAPAGRSGMPVLLTTPTRLSPVVRERLVGEAPPSTNPPTPPAAPGPTVVLPLLPAGKTAADYPQTTPSALIAAVRDDLLAAQPTLPPPSPDLPADWYAPQPVPAWAVPDPAWSSRACAALRDTGALALVDTSWRVYEDGAEPSGRSCHLESSHARTRLVLRASAPGVFEDVSGLEGNPAYVKSVFAGVTVYISSDNSPVGPIGYASTANGTFLTLIVNDGSFRRMGDRAALATVVLAGAADALGR